MNALLGWLITTLVIALSGALLGSVIGSAALAWMGRRVASIEPGRRLWILRGVAWLPAMLAVVFMGVAYYPTLLDLMGIAADHCRSHPGHTLHLCFVHYPPPEISLVVTLGFLGVLAAITRHWWVQWRGVRRGRRWTSQLVDVATYDEAVDAYVVDSDRLLALTTGFFRPRILVSNRLLRTLTPSQCDAVLAHEQAHRRRFDSLHWLVTALVAVLYWPTIRQQLLDAIDLASEQLCDEVAAQAVDDRLTVAEAILAVAGARQEVSAPDSIRYFGDTSIEQRVQALVDDDWRYPGGPWVVLLAAALLVVLMTNLHLLHHWLEYTLAWLL